MNSTAAHLGVLWAERRRPIVFGQPVGGGGRVLFFSILEGFMGNGRGNNRGAEEYLQLKGRITAAMRNISRTLIYGFLSGQPQISPILKS